MNLSQQDANLFFRLMLSLYGFVNRKLQTVPGANSPEAYERLSSEEKLKLRGVLFSKPELIDLFVEENPFGFGDEELRIVAGWRDFVSGKFYLERCLKKYAIFISSDDEVYGVLGLHDPLDAVVDRRRLPLYADAVLLPFKGRIVYDGVLPHYNVFFGRGISGSLKETYMAAKQRGGIIETLGAAPAAEPDAEAEQDRPAAASPKPAKNWRPEMDDLATRARKLRGGSGQAPICTPAFSLVKASLELGQAALADAQDLDHLRKCLKKVERAARGVETILDRAEW